jgi:hypothetical protein
MCFEIGFKGSPLLVDDGKQENKKPTLDLRFRHGRHAANVCLRLGFSGCGDDPAGCVGGDGEIGVAVVACVVRVDSSRGSGEIGGRDKASMLPGKSGNLAVRCRSDCCCCSGRWRSNIFPLVLRS